MVIDESLELYVGDEGRIYAELDPEEAGNITYNSSNMSVVTVDSNGKVKAVGEGEAVITVRFAGNYEYRSSKATVTVKVSKYDTEIELHSEDSLDLEVGDEDSIVAVLYLGNDEVAEATNKYIGQYTNNWNYYKGDGAYNLGLGITFFTLSSNALISSSLNISLNDNIGFS